MKQHGIQKLIFFEEISLGLKGFPSEHKILALLFSRAVHNTIPKMQNIKLTHDIFSLSIEKESEVTRNWTQGHISESKTLALYQLSYQTLLRNMKFSWVYSRALEEESVNDRREVARFWCYFWVNTKTAEKNVNKLKFFLKLKRWVTITKENHLDLFWKEISKSQKIKF